MIPIRLQMSNFLSYGDNVPPLDFTQFSVACLSGKNGQGKSALLDALTWVIWGEGRKASQDRKADSGLLKIGENQMWVDLIVDLEGDRYRIIRKFSRLHNKNHPELELQVFDEKSSNFVSLSSPSIRLTQNRINRLLRMDYDTFINSAFILQGRVDEFTGKSASERKQILSEVLGLSHYGELSFLARKHLRENEAKLINITNRLEQLNREIFQKEGVEQELKLIQANENSINSRIKVIEKKVQFLEQKLSKLNFDKDRKKELDERINSEKKEILVYERKMSILEQNIKNYQIILAQKNKIISDYKQYQYLYDKNQRMLSLMQEYRKLVQIKGEVEKKIDKTKYNLLMELQQKKKKYAELQEQVNSLMKTKEEVLNLKISLKKLDNLLQRQEDIQREGSRLNIEIESKKNQIVRIKGEVKQNHEKIDLLAQSKQMHCPLCESPLDEQRKIVIKQNTEKEIAGKNYEINVLTKETEQLSNKKAALLSEWKENRNALKQKDETQNKLATHSFLIKEGQKAEGQLKILAQEIRQLEEIISKELYAPEEKKQVAELEQQIKEHGYADDTYVKINRDLERFKKAPLQNEKLLEAENSIIDLKKEFAEVKGQLESKTVAISNFEKEFQKIVHNIEELPGLEKLTYYHQKLLSHLQKYYTRLYQKKGICQEKIANIEKLQLEAQNLENEKAHHLHQKEIYKKLTSAFGKNGIQAMIIENAIPELEDEANVILAQLSNEKTTISLESVRELKSGDARETLDIKIHDDMGIRPYELYSGGETFRIDFAIRIALSKLLAYRAGARLKTLVIDEGFGTQDEEGLEKLVQAINAIQSDFDKILVITHLSFLKDAFPVRIEVWKDPTLGSRFELIHL